MSLSIPVGPPGPPCANRLGDAPLANARRKMPGPATLPRRAMLGGPVAPEICFTTGISGGEGVCPSPCTNSPTAHSALSVPTQQASVPSPHPPSPSFTAAHHTRSAELRAVLKGPDFFFLLRTAPRDHRPPTANSHQPPTATNRQLPSTANRHQPPTTNRQRRPTANHCQPPPTANRQPPPTMVEHMECPRAFLGKLVPEHFFFSPLRTALAELYPFSFGAHECAHAVVVIHDQPFVGTCTCVTPSHNKPRASELYPGGRNRHVQNKGGRGSAL